MRTKILPLTIALIAGLSTLALGRTASRAAVSLPDVDAKIAAITQAVRDIEETNGQLSTYRRLANENERGRLDHFIATLQSQLSALKDSVAIVTQLRRNADACPTCADRLANVRSATDALHADAMAFANQCRSFVAQVKRTIAVAKRAVVAVRRTDRALVAAFKLSEKSSDAQQAYAGLRQASEFQEDAKQALLDHQFERAMKLTLQAREILGATAKEALDSTDMAAIKNKATAFYQATDQKIAELSAQIDAQRNPKAAKLLAMAREQQQLARQAVGTRPFVALKHAENARRIVNELSHVSAQSQHAGERVQQLQQKADEAKSVVGQSGSEAAKTVLSKGLEHLEKASELDKKGNDLAATVQLDIAAKLLAKSVDMAKGGPAGGLINMDREISRTRLIIRRAESAARTDEQKARIKQARELVQQAAAGRADQKAALQILDKATDLAFSVIAQGEPPRPAEEEPVDEE